MSYDENDAAYDAYMDQLFKEFRETEGQEIADDAVASFQDERLRSYFVANPTLVEPAVRQLATRARFHHRTMLSQPSSSPQALLKSG
jgi:hypothetical protein